MACAVLLGGCGASLDSEGPAGGQRADAGLTGSNPPLDVAPQSAGVRLPASAATYATASTPGNAAYKIGPQDVLEVSVFKVPELSKSVQVADAGTVNLPLVGEVPAAGRTAQDVERDLSARLGAKYLQNPQVTVFIKEYNSQRVTVEGAVRKPGVFPYRGKTSLVQFVAMAEGLNTERASSEVIIFRQINGRRSAAKFDLDEIRSGQAEDPVMQPGDVIVVSDSTAKIVFNNLVRALPSGGAFVGLF